MPTALRQVTVCVSSHLEAIGEGKNKKQPSTLSAQKSDKTLAALPLITVIALLLPEAIIGIIGDSTLLKSSSQAPVSLQLNIRK